MNYLKDPFRELKKLKSLTLCALLISMSVLTSLLNFYVGNAIKFSFTFLFIAIIAMKFGPIIAASAYAITDIIQFIAKPVGPYQPLLTLTCVLSGLIFGLFLYKNKTNLWRIIASELIIGTFINTLLNSYFISILYGKVFKEFLLIRIPKNLIMLPIEIIILTIALKSIKKIKY